MQTIIGIPFFNFKEKIRITKEWCKKAKIEIIGNIVYIEHYESEEQI